MGGTQVQRNTRTGQLTRHPTAQTPTEKTLADLAISQRQAAIDAAQDRRAAASTAAESRKFELEQKRTAADEAKRKKRLEETQQLRDKQAAYSSIVNDAEFIKEQVGLAKELAGFLTTGVQGELMSKFGANDAADLRAVIETLKARNAFQALADLADQGVKLTPISNEEIRLAAASLGSLDANTSPKFLAGQLDNFLKRYERTLGKARVGLRRTIRDLEGRVAPEDMESAVKVADESVINFDDLPDK